MKHSLCKVLILVGILGIGVFAVTGWLLPKRQAAHLVSMIRSGDADGVSKLISKHPRLKEIDLMAERRGNITPLSASVGLDQLEVCKVLISLGADINTQDKAGGTPLHTAVRKGNTEIVSLLIQEGADVRVRDLRGESPLDLAMESNNSDIQRLLLSASSRGEGP
jgi:ankyrin repeat protein